MKRTSLTRWAGATAGALIIATLTVAPARADLAQQDFSDGTGSFWNWGLDGSGMTVNDDGQLCGTSTGNGIGAGGLGASFPLPEGHNVADLELYSTGEVQVKVVSGPNDSIEHALEVVDADTTTEVSIGFDVAQAADPAKIIVDVSNNADGSPRTVCLDNVAVTNQVEQVTNGGFDDGLTGWTHYGFVEGTARVTEEGAFCATVPAGAGDYSVALFQDLTLAAGAYSFSFDSSGAGPIVGKVQQEGGAYTSYGAIDAEPSDALTSHSVEVAIADDPVDPRLTFQVHGNPESWEFCVDNVSYVGGAAAEPYEPDTGPRVRVNQVGYLTHGPKNATVVTDASEPVAWSLAGESGEVASGTTTVLGDDASAGIAVHGIDFTDVTTPGTYTLSADGETSYEFSIGTEAYEDLRTDALNYFYLARSGIEIDAAIVGEEYAREAGHVSEAGGDATNQGDLNVPCQNAADAAKVYTDGYGWEPCDYTLDVVGGWYDAGDHGKYVVNGGIATAQLLGTYERTKTAASADHEALADGTLNVPESSNGVPDVLDEARWQLEFMMSMQVPEGAQFAGLVHHKIHDDGWTGLPLAPADDPQVRELHRPSTAATLNLSAAAAQGARLFAPYDSDFAQELLETARSTWEAALATPDLYAPVADGADGGGPYDDDDVTDEFYWAAAELFITTGEREFEDYLRDSDVDEAADVADGFYWGSLAALAKLDLATVPNDYANREDIRDQVIAGADELLEIQQDQEFGLALADDGFEWGSNSAVLNNQVILGTAYDLTGDAAYAAGVVESMDYLLGRNALNVSYITDYGTVTSQNQHSRWFTNQLDESLPHPPAGSVAGGPNADTGTWDPVIIATYPDRDCAPQLCYIDHIESWSTNEITVNWNSALSWVASWMADYDQGSPIVEPCSVSYTVHGSWPAGYNTQIWVENTSDQAIKDWELMWAYPADDQVSRQAWSAQWSQEAEWVTAAGERWNGTLRAGQRATIGFIGTPGTLADAPPEQFWLNGQPCTLSHHGSGKAKKDRG
ncbi:glycoside hydrolase family 9 protein [Demequina globuliformis]|uniref:glycoside hydrolase family 9 protein n=1 Tax=Demequina globuliformis TaxID=676202 RepID=UPI00078354EE|nr:glycoside hydrolase family 9 protein [Demequina globuliformis]